MDASLTIGGKVDQEGLAMAASAITEVFKAGHEYRMSEAVMLKALSVVSSAAKVDNTTIRDCHFVGEDKSVKVSTPTGENDSTCIRVGN